LPSHLFVCCFVPFFFSFLFSYLCFFPAPAVYSLCVNFFLLFHLLCRHFISSFFPPWCFCLIYPFSFPLFLPEAGPPPLCTGFFFVCFSFIFWALSNPSSSSLSPLHTPPPFGGFFFSLYSSWSSLFFYSFFPQLCHSRQSVCSFFPFRFCSPSLS